MHGYSIKCLTANSNVDLMEAQIREFKTRNGLYDEWKSSKRLGKAKISDTNTKVVAGLDGLIECATYDGADTVLNSAVGMIGLQPTLEAIKARKTIALANKETLAAGGHLVTNLAKEYGVSILPVDSEHSAIFQAMQGKSVEIGSKENYFNCIRRSVLRKTLEELEHVIAADALKHPNWDMGQKNHYRFGYDDE